MDGWVGGLVVGPPRCTSPCSYPNLGKEGARRRGGGRGMNMMNSSSAVQCKFQKPHGWREREREISSVIINDATSDAKLLGGNQLHPCVVSRILFIKKIIRRMISSKRNQNAERFDEEMSAIFFRKKKDWRIMCGRIKQQRTGWRGVVLEWCVTCVVVGGGCGGGGGEGDVGAEHGEQQHRPRRGRERRRRWRTGRRGDPHRAETRAHERLKQKLRG